MENVEWPPVKRLGVLSAVAAYAPPLAVLMVVACLAIVVLAAWFAVSPLVAGATGFLALVAWAMGLIRASVWALLKDGLVALAKATIGRLPLAKLAIPLAAIVVLVIAWFGFPALSRNEWFVLSALFAVAVLAIFAQYLWYIRRQSLWRQANGL